MRSLFSHGWKEACIWRWTCWRHRCALGMAMALGDQRCPAVRVYIYSSNPLGLVRGVCWAAAYERRGFSSLLGYPILAYISHPFLCGSQPVLVIHGLLCVNNGFSFQNMVLPPPPPRGANLFSSVELAGTHNALYQPNRVWDVVPRWKGSTIEVGRAGWWWRRRFRSDTWARNLLTRILEEGVA